VLDLLASLAALTLASHAVLAATEAAVNDLFHFVPNALSVAAFAAFPAFTAAAIATFPAFKARAALSALLFAITPAALTTAADVVATTSAAAVAAFLSFVKATFT